MDFRLLFFLIVLSLGFFCIAAGDTPKVRRTYIWMMLTILTMESCLRGISVGPDTHKYREIFDFVDMMSWGDIWDSFVDRYFHRIGDTDVGYTVLQKIVHIFTDDFQIFLFVCALFFFIPFGELLSRNARNLNELIFIFVFYVALFNPIAMSGTRKEIALGLSILACMRYNDKQYKKAIFWFVIGALIHMSILAVLLYLVVVRLNPEKLKKLHLLSFLLIPVSVFSSGWLISLMAETVENDHYALYANGESLGGGYTFVIAMELLLLLCYIAIKPRDMYEHTRIKNMYSMLPMATFLIPLVMHNGSMVRLSQYFHIYILFLVPFAVSRLFNSNSGAIRVALSLILIVWATSSTSLLSSYYFFWNDPNPYWGIISF